MAEKASIARLHLEGSGAPTAELAETVPTRFKVRISDGQDQDLELTELDYSGPDRDPFEWHTQASVVHGIYSGNGDTFRSGDDAEAFFVLGKTMHASPDGEFEFYHSGFEWAGGEDTSLSIRWGRCKKLQLR